MINYAYIYSSSILFSLKCYNKGFIIFVNFIYFLIKYGKCFDFLLCSNSSQCVLAKSFWFNLWHVIEMGFWPAVNICWGFEHECNIYRVN